MGVFAEEYLHKLREVEGRWDDQRVFSSCAASHAASFSAGGDAMSTIKIVGIALIAAGFLGLVYGSFSYTKETHEAKIGSLELSMKEKETSQRPDLGWRGCDPMRGQGRAGQQEEKGPSG
jgi:hypothetical protein